METNRQCLFLGTGRTPPIFASLRDLCGFAVNSSHPVAGESEATAMSLEWPADLLMEESSGRAMARNLNIRITGTLGVLLKAKRDGQIASLASPRMPRKAKACHFVATLPSFCLRNIHSR